MKTRSYLTAKRRADTAGHALVLVLVFLLVGLLVLGATMQWASTNGRLIARNNQYFAAQAAAEAATEKIISEMAYDYQSSGAATVVSKLDTYRSRKPEVNENPDWADFTFSNAQGSTNATYVNQQTTWAVSSLISQYQGLSGYAATFRVVSNARSTLAGQDVTAAIRQDFQIATIPVFQFAIFYNVDLEIHPGANMTVRGRVHSNKNFYTRPDANLTFYGDVTSAGSLNFAQSPDDPRSRNPSGVVTYNAEHDAGVNSLNLPLGMENSPENVRKIVEKPPSGESATSEIGRQRFYNKADMVVEVYDGRVDVTTKTGTAVTYGTVSSFVRTNVSFFNKRESKTIQTTELDVAGFKTWAESGSNPLKTALGRSVNSVWISDNRTLTSSLEPGVRLVNGQTLPNAGLTVASPNPIYVKGHYNVPTSDIGTANTANTKPAALIGDAVTILSGSWSDGASSSALSSRVAANTTVNAAILAGIVPSGAASYSGGVENFPRFLEDWSGKTLTYNGSMIVMFPSQYATGTWKGTGSTYGIYNAPSRNWAFDMNFLDPTKLPPGTPEVRAVIRGTWTTMAPGAVGG